MTTRARHRADSFIAARRAGGPPPTPREIARLAADLRAIRLNNRRIVAWRAAQYCCVNPDADRRHVIDAIRCGTLDWEPPRSTTRPAEQMPVTP